ncbi:MULTISPECIES: cation-translocating P-type ATPase [Paenibacillus]|uniref:cation-translocating P-type ATPase n=1 Tax=Paenibacillus TaxID=44249 RepID=UPI0004F879EE|nr:cation-translocating P-type ATPase [Paenibacillus odorifer]AIQ73078.1 ATPase [Paenibacillus odorifer]MEC0130011.1 cation-translocating P-type ATPase [Paenibacillus odorifer]MEC0223138.1 cation-translocating P-type ATPase [Paenibacillus odorifer]OME26294.1 ATPase [Paenibacillus odorifer]OME35857.1 ATPase [Paenibacillus odorifer]
MEYYRNNVADSLQDVQSSANGLTSAEVDNRLKDYGFNELKGKKKDPVWKLFLENFKDPMVVVLLIAAIVQIVMGQVMESLIIFLVLILNAVISVIQTRKAESSLDALQQMSAPEAKVLRDGELKTVPARELVRGDIVWLEAGDFVPADGRIIESESLKINEGMLTGESEAVEKHTNIIAKESPLGDRRNMAFSGSLVVYGRGTLVVTGTALTTEIGKIAELIESAEAKQTPLQRKLETFSKQLGVAIILLSIVIFAIQAGRVWLSNETVDTTEAILNALMFAVAVAVAAIPEALSSIVTIVLSVGTNKMAKQHAIIRKLPAVEALGSTSVICTDKTGTLTQNKMTVVDYFLPEGDRDQFNQAPEEWSEEARRLLHIAVLCNDSNINEDGKELGDPTEVALIAFSNSKNKDYKEIRDNFPREAELPFDSDRKLMTTLHTFNGQKAMITKGGPDVLFGLCSHVLLSGKEVPMTPEVLERFFEANEEFSSRALRVLAYAYKTVPNTVTEVGLEDEQNLVLVGLTAMIDPPREAVYGAIAESQKAGIRTIMITGDHKTTAQAIGRDIGLMTENEIAVTGQELDAMSDEELDQKLEQIGVYARVSPENKIRIVRAWQRKGKITAMTGDGVNDAPALKQADIGVAMGSGTDVAKDAAAMILTDDNFVSIVNAVSVGRTVFDNIKKAIAYLFSGNLGAIIAILFALIFNWINPFTAIQLLFINLANDSLPAIALGMEKPEPNVMNRKPRELKEGIFAGGMMQAIVTRGLLIGIAVIISLYIGLQDSPDMGVAMAFTTLILSRTLQTFAARSNSQTAIEAGLFSNKYVIGAVLVCFAFYGIAVLPGVREIFSIPASFGMSEWLIAAGLALGSLILMELTKVVRRAFTPKSVEQNPVNS